MLVYTWDDVVELLLVEFGFTLFGFHGYYISYNNNKINVFLIFVFYFAFRIIC